LLVGSADYASVGAGESKVTLFVTPASVAKLASAAAFLRGSQSAAIYQRQTLLSFLPASALLRASDRPAEVARRVLDAMVFLMPPTAGRRSAAV